MCWAPQYLMSELIELAKSNLDQLKAVSVVELTVGYIEVITEQVKYLVNVSTKSILFVFQLQPGKSNCHH